MQPPPPPAVQLLQLITGSWVAHAVAVAARLQLADHVAGGPRTVATLAEQTQCHPDSLRRLLRALASVGLFAETAPGEFGPTPMSEALRTADSGSMRAMALFTDEACHRTAWQNLEHSVRTGATAFRHVHGQGFFEYCQKHPSTGAIFDQAMSSFAAVTHAALVKAYDFAPFTDVVDVGGGHGSLLAAILRANPHLRGILFDQPHVVDGARRQPFLTGDLAPRCRLEAGNFFESAPVGGQVYLMKNIIHDWSDDHSRRILQQIRQVIPTNGRVLLAEHVIRPGNDPDFGKILDLEMLVMTDGGRERTADDFANLFASAGFKMTRVIPTEAPLSWIEGEPASRA